MFFLSPVLETSLFCSYIEVNCMNKNVGTVDRVVRIVAGVALLGWMAVSGNMLGLIGLVPLATALLSWCPLYTVLGVNTGAK